MHKINDKIFIGDYSNANDDHFRTGNNIKAVFNLSNHKNKPDIDHCVHYPIEDSHLCTADQLYYAVRTLDDMVEEHGCVLIHCLAGVSRSVTVLAIYLAWKDKGSFDNAVNYIANIRPIANPNKHFMKIGPEVLKKLRGW